MSPRRVHLVHGEPIEILFRGHVVLRVMATVNQYREPLAWLDLASPSAAYDWSPRATEDIRTAMEKPQ
jgi:hypothetical protein